MTHLRRLTPNDVEAVARLHAASWQHAYADVLSAEFLCGPVIAERTAAWTSRVPEIQGDAAFGFVVDEAGQLTGFSYVILGADPEHGHLLDNLHVAPRLHGGGLGRRLLGAVAHELQRRQAHGGLYLWVYASNEKAQGFYARCGATRVEQAERVTVEGRAIAAYRYAWASATALAAGVAMEGREL